ncbi:MAG TPA: hypothetical protein VK819_04500 [Acidobacteriaceae bacterium]|jgi:hypothetical protein|nr:hypothetical protein [Acidobacteriaceae bacterium]
MRNVTFTADEALIEKARVHARSQGTSLNAAFREWLSRFVAAEGEVAAYDAMMNDLQAVKAEEQRR